MNPCLLKGKQLIIADGFGALSIVEHRENKQRD